MKRTLGQSLVELLLVLGVVAASAGIVYGVYRGVSRAHAQAEARQQAQDVIQRIQDAFLAQSNYAGLTQERALAEGLFGKEADVVGGRVLVAPLGEVMVTPVDARVRGQVVDNAGFEIIFQDAPGELCPTLLLDAAKMARWVRVGGQRLDLDPGVALDPAMAAGLCAKETSRGRVRVALAFINERAGETLVACVPPQAPQQQAAPCPAGQTGQRLQQRTGQCTQAYGDVQWSAWATVSSTCQACPGPETGTHPCPPGQYGQQAVVRQFDCAAGDWGEWKVLTSTCQACPQPQTRVGTCLAGQAGHTLEKRLFDCSAGAWGPWVVQERHCSGVAVP